ncbi:MAG: response regulator [Acidobacteria bacterium]|nr:response regulator [Acidobacteriota bacterium]
MLPIPTGVILLVEDNTDDADLILRAFERAGVANAIHRVEDGHQAMAYLAGEGKYAERLMYPLPAVILLDLNMPRINGFQFLVWLRTQSEIRRIPVVVLTESKDSASVNRAYDAGANSYLVKPATSEEINRVVEDVERYWVGMNERPRLILKGKAGD